MTRGYDPRLKPMDLREIDPDPLGPSLYLVADRDGRMHDLSGNRFVATNSGGVTASCGPMGPALAFNGSTGEVDLPVVSSLFYTTATVIVALKLAIGGGDYAQAIFGRQTNINISYVSNNFCAYDWHINAYHDSGVAIMDGRWHTVGAVFNAGETNGSSFYIDGQYIGSFTWNTPDESVNPNQNWIVGNNYVGQNFKGLIGSAVLYSRCLSPAEILAEYMDPYRRLRPRRRFGGRVTTLYYPASLLIGI